MNPRRTGGEDRGPGLSGRALGLLLLLGLPACGGDAGEPAVPAAPLAAVRDSAGIEIVEIDLEQARRVVEARSEPEWVIGAADDAGDEGAPALHEVVDARLLADGTVAIAEASSQEIVLVDPSGGRGHLRIGGEGDGPTEFRRLRTVFDEGPERIGAYDEARARHVVLSRDGSLVSERRILRSRLERVERSYLPLDDGRYLLVHLRHLPEGPAPEGFRGTAPIFLVDGPRVDTLVRIPGRTTFRNDQGMGPVPFGATTAVAPTDDGLWIGDTDERAARLLGLDGTPRRIVRWSFGRSRTLTPARIDSLVEALAARAPEPDRARAREIAASYPFPDREPAFGSLVVDAAGRLWIGEYVEPEAQLVPDEPWPARQWLVVDAGGRPLGIASTPEGLRVTQVGRDFVVGVHTDSLGVETVRLHRLDGPSGPAR